MSHEHARTPDYLLERLAAGDLPPDERAAVQARLDSEADGAARLASIAEDGAATLARIPPAIVAAEVARRRRRGARPSWILVPAVAAAAVALLVNLPSDRQPMPEPERDATIVKGLRPHLVVHRQSGAADEPLAPGASARAGELLQLGYVSAGSRYGAIVSIDGRGTVTRHWPAFGTAAGALTSHREVLLPESFRLDDAPAFERFILIAGDRPFPLQGVLDAAEALARRGDARDAPLPLGGGLVVSSIVVTKESP